MGFYSYYLGLDLGQMNDYTALTLLEEPLYVPDPDTAFKLNIPGDQYGWLSPDILNKPQRDKVRRLQYKPLPVLSMRHLHRFHRGTPYTEIVRHVQQLLQRTPVVDDVALIVDATGVGRGIIDMMRQQGMKPFCITITGGKTVTAKGYEYHVPKHDLIMAAQLLLQSQRVKIARSLPDAETLTNELLNYQIKITDNANATYNARGDSAHDDLVLAFALAGWFRDHMHKHFDALALRTASHTTERL